MKEGVHDRLSHTNIKEGVHDVKTEAKTMAREDSARVVCGVIRVLGRRLVHRGLGGCKIGAAPRPTAAPEAVCG